MVLPRVPRRRTRQNLSVDPLNDNILKFRDLMVNSKVFANCKKQNNFAAILS